MRDRPKELKKLNIKKKKAEKIKYKDSLMYEVYKEK